MSVISVDPGDPPLAALTRAAQVLAGGGLVAFPTETVYGLGADARNGTAVGRIFAVKGRPADNPLIVHLADASQLREVAASVPPLAQELARRWWPGPLTLVVEARAGLPAQTTGGLASVAVRVPAHPVALGLVRAAGVPVAAPSANRSGRPSPTTAAHVVADLGDAVDLVLDAGPCPVGVESTVVDTRGRVPVVLREGAVAREQLGLATATDGAAATRVASPGTRYRHYAPACEVALAGPGQGATLAAALTRAGRRTGLIATTGAPEGVIGLARFADAAGLARVLYGGLRAAEDADLDVVVVEGVEEVGIGRAVMDRLRRAAA
ncbi:MAG TPA: L-threonylcarbamoyladenylate synthase [Egibacteraceae bacterium]|nr:L-threonylcarbamoyladenylate synthase [Egibacteraceae bacterium]